jgi:hypothetical protein
MLGVTVRANTNVIEIVVKFPLPEGATRRDAINYCADAVVAECGGLHPDDPMSHLNRDKVRVRVLSYKQKTDKPVP